jgi:DNA-binding NarL/FixJ family response regulator
MPYDGSVKNQEPAMNAQPENPTPAAQLLRLLIVDDVSEVRRELRLLFMLSGSLEVAGEAANGREALELMDALHPDVVLLDLEMPVMDGYETARQIKARCPDCRVVAFSVHSYEAARQKAFRAGVDEFIEKGASLTEILQKIEAL